MTRQIAVLHPISVLAGAILAGTFLVNLCYGEEDARKFLRRTDNGPIIICIGETHAPHYCWSDEYLPCSFADAHPQDTVTAACNYICQERGANVKEPFDKNCNRIDHHEGGACGWHVIADTCEVPARK
jgi:hypothetical protein